MKKYRARLSEGSHFFTAPADVQPEAADDRPEPEDGFRDGGNVGLPEGWQEILTGLQWARLFRIASHHGGDTEWHAEITLNGTVRRLRCASELRARAWLAVQGKPSFTLGLRDMAELNERLRDRFFRGA